KGSVEDGIGSLVLKICNQQRYWFALPRGNRGRPPSKEPPHARYRQCRDDPGDPLSPGADEPEPWGWRGCRRWPFPQCPRMRKEEGTRGDGVERRRLRVAG